MKKILKWMSIGYIKILYATNIKRYFETKQKAMSYAINYMKTHPNG